MNTGTKENKTDLSALGLRVELKAEIFVLQKKAFYLFPFLSFSGFFFFVLEISPGGLGRE